MGWSRGSEIFETIISTVSKYVTDKDQRKEIYKPIIESFMEHDWDTDEECVGQDEAFDEARREVYFENGWTMDEEFEEDDDGGLIIEWTPEEDDEDD